MMTQTEFIQELIKHSYSLTFPLAQEVVDIFFKEIAQALQEGKKVTLRGFGTFNIKIRSAYTARNPGTGQPVNVDSKRVAFFKASPIFLIQLNKGEER